MTKTETTSAVASVSAVDAVRICRGLLQVAHRDGTGTPYDWDVVENVTVALQMITEPVGTPYPLPGPAASVAYLWETARLAECPYRNRVMPYLRAFALFDWLPQRNWLRPAVNYVDGAPDRGALHALPVAVLPHPDGVTPRCGNARPHRSVLSDARVTVARTYPELHGDAASLAAEMVAAERWATTVAGANLPACPAHTLSDAGFRAAAELAVEWLDDDERAAVVVAANTGDPIADLAWSLLHEPIAVSGSSGHLWDGRARLSLARRHGVERLPVAIVD